MRRDPFLEMLASRTNRPLGLPSTLAAQARKKYRIRSAAELEAQLHETKQAMLERQVQRLRMRARWGEAYDRVFGKKK